MRGKHLFASITEAKNRILGGLKNYLDERSPRQRLYIVLTALLLFAAVDIWMIVRSFQGDGHIAAVKHIETPIKR